MLTKFILKNGYGSPGHTAKNLIKQFNNTNQSLMADNPNEVFKAMLIDRMHIAHAFGQAYYDRMHTLDKISDFLENDICTFTFLVLFSEGEKFRKGVQPNQFGDSYFDSVTETIYEVCRNRSSLCYLSLDHFKTKAMEICCLKIYNI